MTCTMNSIVNLYKPVGPTSFSMVRSVKQALSVKKAGHIGTLDPLAEGVLPICLNRSTRIIQFLTRLNKVYRAKMKLGITTDTQDSTGQILATEPTNHLTEDEVRSVIQGFSGEQQQVPPMFSAKKKNGVPLYKLARNGITIMRDPVTIHVYSIEFLEKSGDEVTFKVHCSAGTYVRTLCHDIGLKLGCGAHMTRLVRERVGHFDMASSVTLEELNHAQTHGGLSDKLLQTDQVLDFLPEIQLCPDHIQSIAHGAAITKGAVQALPDRFQPGMLLRATHGDHQIAAVVEALVDQDQFADLQPHEVVFKLKRVLL